MKKAEAKVEPVQFSAKELEMAIYALKIWRQVIVGQTFMELRDGQSSAYSETIVEIDLAIEKLERAKGK